MHWNTLFVFQWGQFWNEKNAIIFFKLCSCSWMFQMLVMQWENCSLLVHLSMATILFEDPFELLKDWPDQEVPSKWDISANIGP